MSDSRSEWGARTEVREETVVDVVDGDEAEEGGDGAVVVVGGSERQHKVRGELRVAG